MLPMRKNSINFNSSLKLVISAFHIDANVVPVQWSLRENEIALMNFASNF